MTHTCCGLSRPPRSTPCIAHVFTACLCQNAEIWSQLYRSSSDAGSSPGPADSQHRAGLRLLPQPGISFAGSPSGLLRAASRAAHNLCMKLGDPIWPPSRSRPFHGPSCCQDIILSPWGTRGLLPITVGISMCPPRSSSCLVRLNCMAIESQSLWNQPHPGPQGILRMGSVARGLYYHYKGRRMARLQVRAQL